MPLHLETADIEALVHRILDSIAATIASQTGDEGVEVRYKIGILRSDIIGSLIDDTFSGELLACFTAAKDAGAKLSTMMNTINLLYSESPKDDVSKTIINQAIVFCLATISRIVTTVEFVSSDDAIVVLDTLRGVFDTAREIISDLEDPMPYRTLLALAGSTTNYLANSILQLPRMMTFELAEPLPALAASQAVYRDASRWEELVDENKIVHPAFCRRELRGLSK